LWRQRLRGLRRGAEKGRCHLHKENNGAQKWKEKFLSNEAYAQIKK
jgi:hypothetical protein